jgi:DNA-binding NarL/FixJ family response regulator
MNTIRTIKLKLRSVLVVTNKPLSALRMRAALCALPNCSISFAFDKTDARQLAGYEQPDLLIIDHDTAFFDSLVLAKVFHRLCPDTKIITLAGQPGNNQGQYTANLFVHRILEKSVSLAELYQVVLAALADIP